MKLVQAACPFYQMGAGHCLIILSILSSEKVPVSGHGLLLKMGRGQNLGQITKNDVLKFLWKNMLCRFGLSRKLISDNGKQNQRRKVTKWCKYMKITQSLTSAAHPQANGQNEFIYRTIVQALKSRLYGFGKDRV